MNCVRDPDACLPLSSRSSRQKNGTTASPRSSAARRAGLSCRRRSRRNQTIAVTWGYVATRARALANSSFSSSVPQVTRIAPGAPKPRRARTMKPSASRRPARPSPSPSGHVGVDEVRLRLDRVQPRRGQVREQAGPGGPCVLDPVVHGHPVGGQRRLLRGLVEVEHGPHAIQGVGHLGRGQRVAHPQRRQPVDLGERAQHTQPAVPLAHQRRALGLLVGVLGVGLVEHAQDPVGQSVEEGPHLRPGEHACRSGCWDSPGTRPAPARRPAPAASTPRAPHRGRSGGRAAAPGPRPRRARPRRPRSSGTRARGRQRRRPRPEPPRRTAGSARPRRCRGPPARAPGRNGRRSPSAAARRLRRGSGSARPRRPRRRPPPPAAGRTPPRWTRASRSAPGRAARRARAWAVEAGRGRPARGLAAVAPG